MKNHFTWKTPCLLAGILALSACSGGGGGDDSASVPQLPSYDNIERLVVGGKIGYQTKNDHKQLLPPKWDAAHPFASNNIARVIAQGKWQYIDRSGKVLLDAVEKGYDWIYDFDDNGIARYVKGGKFGFLNSEFEEIVSADTHDYYRMSELTSGVYVVNNALTDIGSPQYGLLAANGDVVLDMSYKKIVLDPQSGTAQVQEAVSKHYGCYNIKEKKLNIPTVYTQLDCSTGDYVVGTLDGKKYLIDKNNNKVSDPTKYNIETYYPQNQLLVAAHRTNGSKMFVPVKDALTVDVDAAPKYIKIADAHNKTGSNASNLEKQAFFFTAAGSSSSPRYGIADSQAQAVFDTADNILRPIIYFDADKQWALYGAAGSSSTDAGQYFIITKNKAKTPLAGTWNEVEYSAKLGLLKLTDTAGNQRLRPVAAQHDASQDSAQYKNIDLFNYPDAPTIAVGTSSDNKQQIIANASGILAQAGDKADSIDIDGASPNASRHIAHDSAGYFLMDNNGKTLTGAKKYPRISKVVRATVNTFFNNWYTQPQLDDYFAARLNGEKTLTLLDKDGKEHGSVEAKAAFYGYGPAYDPDNQLFLAPIGIEAGVVFDLAGKKYGESMYGQLASYLYGFGDAGLQIGSVKKGSDYFVTITNSAGDKVYQSTDKGVGYGSLPFNSPYYQNPLLPLTKSSETYFFNTLGKCVIKADKTACPAGM